MSRLIVILVAMMAAHVSADQANRFVNTDIFELEVAMDVQIAPSGSQIVYRRNAMDIMSDRGVSSLWMVDASGSNHRPLLSGPDNISSPRWSPTGDRLAYVSAVEGRGAQIHVRWMDTGQTAVLSNIRQSPSSLSWSPDGKHIAFSMFVKSTGPTLATPLAQPKGATWATPVKIIDSLRYRGDGRGYLEPGFNQLFLLSTDGGTPRQLTNDDYNHGGNLTWTRDSQRIIMSANRQDDWEFDPVESELWSVDITTGNMTALTTRNGPDFSPVVSPDGKKIAYLGFDDQKMGYHNTQVYVMDVDGKNKSSVTQNFDRRVNAVRWAGNSRQLYIQYDDRGRTHIATLSMNGKIKPLVENVGGVSLGRPYTSGGFSVANNGAVAYTSGRSVHRPADVAFVRAGGSSVHVTDLNADVFGTQTLGEVEEIVWQSSADKLEVQGWLIKPPDFDETKKYPLILEIHGGPFAAYGPHFSAELQLFAAAGFVVLYTNPRGSTSYGYDFANKIHHNYPGQDYDDLMSGVDAVIEKGYINKEQLFVTGGSGGGVLSAWIVGKTDRFAAAVVAKPIINWVSAALTTDIGAFISGYWFEKKPWDDLQGYWQRSPLSLVGNVSTPTALLTGEQDHRTPITESEQFYQALKLRKIDSIMIRVPGASHGIASRPSHLIAKVDNILAWFDRYSQ